MSPCGVRHGSKAIQRVVRQHGSIAVPIDDFHERSTCRVKDSLLTILESHCPPPVRVPNEGDRNICWRSRLPNSIRSHPKGPETPIAVGVFDVVVTPDEYPFFVCRSPMRAKQADLKRALRGWPLAVPSS